jgi:tetratricopeptide (TPR) repeat protein
MALKNINRLFQQAVTKFQKGQLKEAQAIAKKILKMSPDNADINHLLGVIELERGQHDSACRLIDRAIRSNPRQPMYFNNLGLAFHTGGHFKKALSAFERAIQLNPNLAGAHYNRGNELKNLGHLAEGLAASDRAVQLEPNYVEAHINRGVILNKLGRPEEALVACERALQVNSEHAEAHNTYGHVLRRLGRLDEALAAHERAIRFNPDYVEAYYGLGAVLNDLCQHEKALEVCEHAIQLDPGCADAYSNLGVYLGDSCRLEQALAACEHAIQLNPEFASAHYNRALLLLQAGDISSGWREYEWRWNINESPFLRRDFHLAQWNGDPLQEKLLLVYAEQGIGDEIMFASYFSKLSCSVKDVIIECDERLLSLFSRSFPGYEFIGVRQRNDLLLNNYNKPVDYKVAAGSLPLYLREVEPESPVSDGYLEPDPVLSQKWRERLADYDGTLKIGISWRGGARRKTQDTRSIPLEKWLPLFRNASFALINLQYGDHEEEIDHIRHTHNVSLLDWDDLDQRQDIDDLAALISTLDLIISVDNLTVHLAGALGMDTATLLPCNSDWRWQLDSEKTHWYPSMHLFRQQANNERDSIINEVTAYAEMFYKTTMGQRTK